MRNVLNIGLRLTLIAVLAAAALGYTNRITSQPIEDQRELAKQETMALVLPDAAQFEEIAVPAEWQDRIVSASVGTDAQGNPVGYAVAAQQKGYGGPVNVMVGLDTAGVLTGASILEHNETPGLGAEAAKPAFIDQYKDKTAPLTVVKNGNPGESEIQAVTGATITSRAVTGAANSAAEFVSTLAEGSDAQ